MANKKAVIKKHLRLTLVKSLIGRIPSHLATVKGLGLSRIRQTVLRDDTPSIRGMARKVSYLLEIKEERS